MKSTKTILLHHQLYKYLNALNQTNPNFLFEVHVSRYGSWFLFNADNPEQDPYMLKTKVEEGFKNCHLVITYNSEQQFWLFRLTPEPSDFFSQIFIHTIESQGFKQFNGGWHKWVFIEGDANFLAPLKKFIEETKPIIEKKVEKQPIPSQKRKDFEQKRAFIEAYYQTPHIREYYRLADEGYKKHLTFALSRLEVADFQGIRNLVIEKLPTDKSWIFLTGENGFGKTSILKAIAKGLAGDEDHVESLPAKSRLILNGYHQDRPFLYEAAPKKLPPNDFPIAAYGAARFLVSDADPAGFLTRKYGKKTYSLFNDDGALVNLDRFLMDAERDDWATFVRLKAIFLKIIPNLAHFESALSEKARRMRYYEKSDTNFNHEPVYLSELGAGTRSILTLIGDMVHRLTAYADNPLEDLKGIVIIDEFDAHLHPKYQYQLPQLLSEAFPKVQFIVATHSPIPILGAKPDTFVVLTVHRTKADGITVERLDDDIEIQNLTVNALLTSDIFNIAPIVARGATPATVEPFDNYDKIKEMTELDKRLQLKNVLNRLK